MNLEKLYQIIESRKNELPEGSYTSSLFKKGRDRIIQKVGEEAVEVVIAAKNENPERLISETADLFFHTLVMLADQGIQLSEIFSELESRNKGK